MPAPVLLDATPLASGHGARGIGAAVRGMLQGLAEVPPADRPRLLVRDGQAPPPGFDAVAVRWPGWPLHRVPDPWPALRGERAARRASGAGAFHATQPSLVPRGRTVATCFDLIPAAYAPEYLGGAGRAGQRAAFARFLARLRAATLVLVPSGRRPATSCGWPAWTPAASGWCRSGCHRPPRPRATCPTARTVLYAGAVEPHKNAALALEAIAAAAPGVRLVMAGPWSARRAARLRGHAARVGADGRVDWLGYVPAGRLAALRAGAAAVLVPSRKEGFGFPVLEAMAAGVPVLASATPALREVGGDAAAAYLPAADAGAWAREISRLADAPDGERARLAEAGRRRAGAYTWARTAEGIVAAAPGGDRVTRVAIDCHMVGQSAAGDAGNGRYARTLVAAMAATADGGDEVASLVATPEGTRALERLGPTRGVPSADVARLARAAPRALVDLDADAAVFTYVSPGWTPCPILLAVHDTSFMTHPEWLGARARAVLRGLVPRSARKAARVLALSETAARDVAEALRIDPGKVRVVSPHPDAAFTPADGAADRVRRRFGLERYVLAVGDLGPRKNLTALGAAVGGLGDPDLVLALVGRPGKGGERIAADTGGRWLGHVSDADLADLYRAAAVTAYPRCTRASACRWWRRWPAAARWWRATAARSRRWRATRRSWWSRRRAASRWACGPRSTPRWPPACAPPDRSGRGVHPGGDGPRGVGGGAGGGGGVRIAMVGTRGIPAAYSGFETAVEHLAAPLRGPRPRGDRLLPSPHDRAPRHVRRRAPGAPADRPLASTSTRWPTRS